MDKAAEEIVEIARVAAEKAYAGCGMLWHPATLADAVIAALKAAGYVTVKPSASAEETARKLLDQVYDLVSSAYVIDAEKAIAECITAERAAAVAEEKERCAQAARAWALANCSPSDLVANMNAAHQLDAAIRGSNSRG